jgi:hypothetical protein
MRHHSGFIFNGQQLDERARQLDDMVLCSPSARMTVARADLKAETTIKIDCGIEIVHRVNDMVEAAGHRRILHEPALLDSGADE